MADTRRAEARSIALQIVLTGGAALDVPAPERPAIDQLFRRTGALTVARRRAPRHATVARSRATVDDGIRARSREDPVARPTARRPAPGASGAKTPGRAERRGANAFPARDIARLALSGTARVAAIAVDAVPTLAIARLLTCSAVRLERDADAGGAMVVRRALLVAFAAAGADVGSTRERSAVDGEGGATGASAVAHGGRRRDPGHAARRSADGSLDRIDAR